MNAKPNIDMLEATRLTREGRLAEAMAILQGGLPGAIPQPPQATPAGDAGQRPAGHLLRGSSIWCRHRPEEGRGLRRSSTSRTWLLTRLMVCRRLGPAPDAGGAARLPRPHGATRLRARPRWVGRTWSSPCAGPAAGGSAVRGADLCQRGGKPSLQALHPKRLHGSACAARGDAARLHPVAGRFCRWHADERVGRGADVSGRLSGAGPVGQCVQVLELVQRSRSAAGSRRALADRRHHPSDHARLLGRAGTGLCRRALSRRGSRGDHGLGLPGPLCGRWGPLRAGVRGRS